MTGLLFTRRGTKEYIMTTVEEINLKNKTKLLIEKIESEGHVELQFDLDTKENCQLHWGLRRYPEPVWHLPPEQVRPAGSRVYDQHAVRTSFVPRNGGRRLSITLDRSLDFPGLVFALFYPDSGHWENNSGRNFNITLSVAQSGKEQQDEISGLALEIIHGEMGDHGWTLMHRFNLCHDLIGTVQNNTDGLAAVYVWMRFSAIRQLDWQRNYNTKPSELSHAQDRLTLKIADMYKSAPQDRELLRLIMTTLGRGGEGQRIRDEILHIMHRHHIKEVSGHFLEEWHQKLHNNTTPDDVVICEAYLEFLRSDGDLSLFYKTLEDGGVSRERMQGFERPITTAPDFIPHLKDALIHDFGDYLSLLKSIHTGTDLVSAINEARYILDEETGGLLDGIWHQKDTGIKGLVDYVKDITRFRMLLNERLKGEADTRRVRDMLFLDLALEDFLRVVIERNIHKDLDGDGLVELIEMVLENIRFSYDNDELSVTCQEWRHLQGLPRFSKDWALHANTELERIGRATGALVDRYYQMLQPKAEYLGAAFNADSWAIALFSEEVVRGLPAFVLSVLIRFLEPVLRRHAKLGNWQVVSPGQTSGWLEVTETLSAVQGKKYDRPSIILADKVKGDEEPPEGAAAIITPDTVDLVSHVAVRARNAHLLFATCYDADSLDRLRSLRGRMLALNINVSGEVEFRESRDETPAVERRLDFEYKKMRLPEFSVYALSSDDFNSGLVGGKSLNLKDLEGKLPGWIHLPVSAALPFGTFEKVLSLDINRKTAGQYHRLIDRLNENIEDTPAELRRVVLELNAPEELAAALQTIMKDSGLGWPAKWDDIWICIKRVWASKWNDRACLSRKAWGIRHEDIFMAVLIQEVVDAEYAFVIHTVNPFTGDRDELYAEAVPGLGETLVGNYPGRSMSFVANKKGNRPEILSHASKSRGLSGGGLIFRSDSNAEDLEGYAGAGIYDSIMLEPPREVTLNYSEDRLTWDEGFRKEFMANITRIGMLVEEHCKAPQDIEGAYVKGRYSVVQTRHQVGLEVRDNK